jgi:hypothetical protein
VRKAGRAALVLFLFLSSGLVWPQAAVPANDGGPAPEPADPAIGKHPDRQDDFLIDTPRNEQVYWRSAGGNNSPYCRCCCKKAITLKTSGRKGQ